MALTLAEANRIVQAAVTKAQEMNIKVSAAVTNHVIIMRPGDCTWREISAATMKTPEPIIEPITRVVESMRPRPLTKPPLLVGSILPSVSVEIER